MPALVTRIGPDDHGRRMTLEEFRDAEEAEAYRYELARGKLEVADVPDDAHGMVVSNLYRAFGLYVLAHPTRILRFGGAGEFRLWLPGLVSSRTPDAAVVLRGTPKDRRGRRPPALAVEVVSVGGEVRDYETKRQEYLVYGLREYWIVDPQARRVTVLVRDGDAWAERSFQGEQAIESLVLPGFAGRVVDLEADEAE